MSCCLFTLLSKKLQLEYKVVVTLSCNGDALCLLHIPSVLHDVRMTVLFLYTCTSVYSREKMVPCPT